MKSDCHWSLSTLGILIALLLGGCGHLFYYPTSYMYVDLNRVEPKPQQIEFKNNDGQKLVGWYFKSTSEKPKAKILFFHGNAENISSHFIALHWILKHGYDYFIFDYPGYGGSAGIPTQASTTASGQAALDWLNQQEPQIPIVIFGQSLGGNIALYTAANNRDTHPICLVVAESTFRSYKKVAQRALSRHWFTWPLQWIPYLVISDEYSAQDRIDKISPTPLLVIHGGADPVVVPANGEDIIAAAKDPKDIWRIPDGYHIQALTGPHSEQYQKKFLDKLAATCAK